MGCIGSAVVTRIPPVKEEMPAKAEGQVRPDAPWRWAEISRHETLGGHEPTEETIGSGCMQQLPEVVCHQNSTLGIEGSVSRCSRGLAKISTYVEFDQMRSHGALQLPSD